jgi:Lar family restriction alleviation protein
MSRSEDVELKSCPFCGREARVVVGEGLFLQAWVRVRCDWCGIQTPGKREIEAAITAWNTRAPSSLPVGWKLTDEMLEALEATRLLERMKGNSAIKAMRAAVAMLSASPPEPGVK